MSANDTSKDTSDDGYVSHDAFGHISANRINGHRDLFQVDFPTGHFIRLKISRAKLKRDLSTDWVYASNRDTVVEVDLSEVQWAQLLCSMNTTGVSCTLNRYCDPHTGELLTPKLPPKHTADADSFASEVKIKAREAAKDIVSMKTSSVHDIVLNRGKRLCHPVWDDGTPQRALDASETNVASLRAKKDVYLPRLRRRMKRYSFSDIPKEFAVRLPNQRNRELLFGCRAGRTGRGS